MGTKTLSDEYLKNIDYFYKQQYLKEISTSSELLVYDWSNGGETEIIVEDIERIGKLFFYYLLLNQMCLNRRYAQTLIASKSTTRN